MWHRELSRPKRNLDSMSDETDWFTRLYCGEALVAVVYGSTELEALTRADTIVAGLGATTVQPPPPTIP